MSRPTRGDAGGRAYLDLQNLARRQGRGTEQLLVIYVLERFLARLAHLRRGQLRGLLCGGHQLGPRPAASAPIIDGIGYLTGLT